MAEKNIYLSLPQGFTMCVQSEGEEVQEEYDGAGICKDCEAEKDQGADYEEQPPEIPLSDALNDTGHNRHNIQKPQVEPAVRQKLGDGIAEPQVPASPFAHI